MAKGAGMIAPNMATMLAFFTTDAAVEPALLRRALGEAVGESLNRITVDGDTSTNDCAVVLASGASGAPRSTREGAGYDAFRDALTQAARAARAHAGARRRGRDARSPRCASRARGRPPRPTASPAPSPSRRSSRRRSTAATRTGAACWPRSAARACRSTSRRVSLWIGDVHVAEGGAARDYVEKEAAAAMQEDPVRLRIRLGEGEASGWIWTSDFSHGYVDINAHYRS